MGARHVLCAAVLWAACRVGGTEGGGSRACREFEASPNVSHWQVGSQPRALELHWTGGAPGRAAAALLRLALRRGLSVRPRLRRGPARLCELVDHAAAQHNLSVVGVAVGWAGEACRQPGARGPGVLQPLAVLGAAPSPLHVRLHAAHRHLPPLHNNTVFFPQDVEETAFNCTEVTVSRVSRPRLMSLVREARHSFLFLDYAVWEGREGVIEAPAWGAAGGCEEPPELLELRVITDEILIEDPPLARAVAQFSPNATQLREVLDSVEEVGLSLDEAIDDAVCSWAKKNYNTFKSWIYDGMWAPTLCILHCSGDPDVERYRRLAELVVRVVNEEMKAARWRVQYIHHVVDCSDSKAVEELLMEWKKTPSWYNLMGVVARGEGVSQAAAAQLNVSLVRYDAAPGPLRPAEWAAGGAAGRLAGALRRLLRDCGWARLAVLSERSQLARGLARGLAGRGLLLREWLLARGPLEATLAAARAADARVLLVNAGPHAAAAVLAAAHELGMTPARGYAWIVREWRCDVAANVSFYSVSFWNCGARAADAGGADGGSVGAGVTRALRERGPWPALAAPLANALLVLMLGYRELLDGHPNYKYNLHDKNVISDLTKSLVSASIEGVEGEMLRFSGSMIAESPVYVSDWGSNETSAKPLATFRVGNDDTIIDMKLTGSYPPPRRPSDGRSQCALPAGEPFNPRCLTPWAVVGGVFAVLLLGALGGCYRAVQCWLARRDSAAWLGVATRLEPASAALAGRLVDRAALVGRGELGAGQFGHVRLAVLGRGPGARAVAVKELRDGASAAEERELLREAGTLATLEHAHVVRLVGVCAVGGPPLLLMEHALFKDLLHYLRARRELVARASSDEAPEDSEAAAEAEHVSPEALTRLAREAASALGYLAHRGLVHRDVRAANCLVDAARRLKLADFGMARQTHAAADDRLAEYACRRRALLPVLWMAPESLARGVFSAASDVWALGVLVLELVTLGERPYGDWSPLRVIHYVTGGGRPELPLDASPQTRGVVMACWQRLASRRCSAAELVAYLAAHPRALRPALLPPPLPTELPSPLPTELPTELSAELPADPAHSLA